MRRTAASKAMRAAPLPSDMALRVYGRCVALPADISSVEGVEGTGGEWPRSDGRRRRRGVVRLVAVAIEPVDSANVVLLRAVIGSVRVAAILERAAKMQFVTLTSDILDDEFAALLANTSELYRRALEAGVPAEDARFILPNAAPTNFHVMVNFAEMPVTSEETLPRARLSR